MEGDTTDYQFITDTKIFLVVSKTHLSLNQM